MATGASTRLSVSAAMARQAREAIAEADVVFFVVDGRAGLAREGRQTERNTLFSAELLAAGAEDCVRHSGRLVDWPRFVRA